MFKWRELRKLEKKERENLTSRIPYDTEGNIVLQLLNIEISNSFFIDGDDDSISLTSNFKDYLREFRDNFASNSISVALDNKTPEIKKEKFKTLYKSFFKFNIIKTSDLLKKNLINCLILFSLGLLTITAVVLITTLAPENIRIVAEIITILGWVFLWECFDLFFFQRAKLKKEQIKNFYMYKAKFHDKKIKATIKDVQFWKPKISLKNSNKTV